jgi:hypothetical protein
MSGYGLVYHRISNIELRTTGIVGAARIAWMSAKEIWRTDEGQANISADRISTRNQTEYIYDVYYNKGKRECLTIFYRKKR